MIPARPSDAGSCRDTTLNPRGPALLAAESGNIGREPRDPCGTFPHRQTHQHFACARPLKRDVLDMKGPTFSRTTARAHSSWRSSVGFKVPSYPPDISSDSARLEMLKVRSVRCHEKLLRYVARHNHQHQAGRLSAPQKREIQLCRLDILCGAGKT